MNLRFEVLPVEVSEHRTPGQSPAEYARAVSQAKAQAAVRLAAQPLPVLGADTDVVLDGEILGKPAGREAGLAMLAKLSGRSHEVFSAVAVVSGRHAETALSVTRVTFGRISPAQAAAYWDSGEAADKAGAYAIQGLGARFVKQIEGSYSGVMGLPLFETCELLGRFGIEVFPPSPAP